MQPLQPDGVNHWYFQLRLFDSKEYIVWNIEGLYTPMGFRDTGFKTQILWDLLKYFQMNTCVITKMLSIPIPKSRNGITVCAAE